MTGYQPLLSTDSSESNPETDPGLRRPENHIDMPTHEGPEDKKPFLATSDIYNFSQDTVADDRRANRGVDAEGIRVAVGTESLLSPDELNEVASEISVMGDTENPFQTAVAAEARSVEGKISAFRKSPETKLPSRVEINNRLAATAIAGSDSIKAGGSMLFSQETRDKVSNAVVGSILIANPDNIEDAKLRDYAEYLKDAGKRGNKELSDLGWRAGNAGVTLENIDQKVLPTAEVTDEADSDEGESGDDFSPELVDSKGVRPEVDTEEESSAEAVIEAALDGDTEKAIAIISKGSEDNRQSAEKFIGQLMTEIDVRKALNEQFDPKRWESLIGDMMQEASVIKKKSKDDFELVA